MKLSVSYLKSKYSKEETIEKINKTTCDYLHVDLMDGIFAGVNNYEKDSTIQLLKTSTKPLDIHLMMKNPMPVIKDLISLNPKFITIHLEIPQVQECLDYLNETNVNVGLAINPETKIEDLRPYLDQIDLVLVMSVHPGKGGQHFLESSIEKLEQLKKYQKTHSFLIAIDGGINEETCQLVQESVDQIVSGSFICQKDNFEEQIRKIIKKR